MKRLGKAFVALATATAMGAAGFAGVSTAMADNGKAKTDQQTITFNNVVVGDKIQGYRLLDIDTITKDTEDNIDKVVYLVNPTYRNILIDVINSYITDITEEIPSATGATAAQLQRIDTQIIEWLTENLKKYTSGEPVNIDDFAKKFQTYVEEHEPGVSGSGVDNSNGFTVNVAENNSTSNSGTSTRSIKIENQQVGYYLFAHTAAPMNATTANNRALSKYMTETVLPEEDLTISLKTDVPTLEKEFVGYDIKDVNGIVNGTSYSVGDIATYKLKGDMPTTLTDFDKFEYTFNDTLGTGLDLIENSVEVNIYASSEAADAGEGGIKVYPANNETYTKPIVDTEATSLKDLQKDDENAVKENGDTLSVQMGNLRAATQNPVITTDSIIVVTYQAEVNAQSIIGDAGNPNSATLTFTNDPYKDTYATTPQAMVTAYTFELDVIKSDGTETPADALSSAVFTLSRQNDAKDGWTIVDNNIEMTKTDGKWQGSVPRLGAGLYKLEETKVPEGYNKADDQYLNVVATYYDEDTQVDGVGMVSAGSIKSLTLQVGTLDGDGKFVVNTTETGADGVVATTVINTTGSKLPSTGGMGTMMLYIVGGLIVLAAAGGLTVAVRKRQN